MDYFYVITQYIDLTFEQTFIVSLYVAFIDSHMYVLCSNNFCMELVRSRKLDQGCASPEK